MALQIRCQRIVAYIGIRVCLTHRGGLDVGVRRSDSSRAAVVIVSRSSYHGADWVSVLDGIVEPF